MYAKAVEVLADVVEILKPPVRLTVPEAAEKYVNLDIPAGYSGPFRNALVYYLVEPAECLTKREFKAVVLVAPAQTGKTNMLVDNWAAHTIVCDPADHMIVQTSQDTARDYSKRRIDRMIAASPEISARLRPGTQNDNTYDKVFRAGNILSLGHPSKNQLAGKAIPKMGLTDYDRMPEDVDCEGSAFFLSMKRTETFLSRGMTLAESSPSKPILDAKWKVDPDKPHEAPPTVGILGLYNTGDRRRLYAPCLACREYFMPQADMKGVFIPANKSIEQAASEAALICPNCGALITQKHEKKFKKSGVWLKEGQTIDKKGTIHGAGLVSDRATFWVPGWFAAFQSWSSIVSSYLIASETYERTHDEEALKNTINLDFGGPYLPKAMEDTRDPLVLENRAEDLEKRVVPKDVLLLLASVDIQKNRFVVQVEGIGEGLESWIVDRFSLRLSYRDNEEGKALPVDPASYPEDWEVLTKNVIKRTYVTEDEREIGIFKTACDSGGVEGVTDNAYKYWRKLRKQGLAAINISKTKFLLVKGASMLTAKPIVETFPDNTKRGNRKASVWGDVPVYLINTNIFKDIANNDINRQKKGPKYVHFPDWLLSSFFAELTAETRTAKGWLNRSRRPNEAFDLMGYVRFLINLFKLDRIDWDNPPKWIQRRAGMNTAKPKPTQPSVANQLAKSRKKHRAARQAKGGFVNRWK